MADPRRDAAIKAVLDVLPNTPADGFRVACEGPYLDIHVDGDASGLLTADEARALARELLIAADKVEGRG